MKKLVLLLLVLCSTTLQLVAQINDMKARAEFDAAEQAYEDKSYATALKHLSTAESLLGSWNAKIGYLRIMTLDKMDVQGKPSTELRTEVQKYMRYANENSENLDKGKFNTVYTIEQKIAIAKERENADALFNSGNYSEAFKLYQQAAGNGNKKAMLKVAEMYENGQGVTKDFPKAIELYKKLSAEGNKDAGYKLGNLYYNGSSSIARDYKTAISYFATAGGGEGGKVEAMIRVGHMFQFGQGTTQSCYMTGEWYKKAMDAGANKGELMAEIASCNDVGRNYIIAFDWYMKAYNNGNKSVKHKIAEYYREGRGNIEKDKQKAKEWENK